MPYSQLNQMAKGKFESTQPKTNNCSADLAFMPENEFVELVWEKGQILTQGQSSRSRKIPASTIFPAHTSKAQEKDEGEVVIPKIGRLGTMEYILNNFSSPGPSGHMGMGQDDDIMVPWLNYPLDDSIQHDYCSEFFPELSGANLNAFSAQNNGLQIYKNSIKDFHMASGHGGKSPEKENASKIIGGSLEPSRPSSSQLCSSSLQQFQTSVPSHRSRVSDFITSDNNNTQRGNSTPIPTPIGDLPNAKLHKQDPGPTRPLQQPCENTELINFSHFSRPAALVKANLQSIGAIASPGLLNIDKLRSNEKGSAAGISNPFESTLIESSCGSRSAADFQGQLSSVPTKMDLKSSMSKPPKEASAEQSEVICREDALRNNISPDQVLGRTSSFAASTAIGRPDGEKVVEPVVASSSVCSGNSAGGASSDPKYNGKRKSQDAEESEYQSEDVEEESVGVRKPAPARGGTGAKRSRAAEVHNLSERRRRDRINEKMRALQELIPNCNKVDKASMLDEAIEYLKALQRQVQIMSMGSGLCMPPMILQTGMQQIQAAPHMAHFSPMGVGMGMGMGFGMGLFDMSSYSTGCPLIQMPPMHGPHFRCPPMSGPTGLPGMARSSLQMFGFPGQGLPLSMPQAPFTRLSGGPFTTTVSTSDVSGVAAPMEVSDSAPQSSTKDHSQLTHKTIVACLQTQKSTQCQATGGFEQSPIVQRNDQTPHVSGN